MRIVPLAIVRAIAMNLPAGPTGCNRWAWDIPAGSVWSLDMFASVVRFLCVAVSY